MASPTITPQTTVNYGTNLIFPDPGCGDEGSAATLTITSGDGVLFIRNNGIDNGGNYQHWVVTPGAFFQVMSAFGNGRSNLFYTLGERVDAKVNDILTCADIDAEAYFGETPEYDWSVVESASCASDDSISFDQDTRSLQISFANTGSTPTFAEIYEEDTLVITSSGDIIYNTLGSNLLVLENDFRTRAALSLVNTALTGAEEGSVKQAALKQAKDLLSLNNPSPDWFRGAEEAFTPHRASPWTSAAAARDLWQKLLKSASDVGSKFD